MGCGASTTSTSSAGARPVANSSNSQGGEAFASNGTARERSLPMDGKPTSRGSTSSSAPLPPSLVALRMARESGNGSGTPLQDTSFKSSSDPFRTSTASDDRSSNMSSGTDDLGRPPPSRASTQRFETSTSSQSLESSYHEHLHHQQQNINAVFGLTSLTGSHTSRRSDTIGPSTSPPPPEDPHAVFIEDDLRGRGSGDQSNNSGAERNPLLPPAANTAAPIKVIIVPDVRDSQSSEGRLSLKERWQHCVRRFPLPERGRTSSFGSDYDSPKGSPLQRVTHVTSPTQVSAQGDFTKLGAQHRQELAKLFEQFDSGRKRRLTMSDLDSGLRRKLALDRVQPHLNLVAIEHSAVSCILQLKATVPPVGVVATRVVPGMVPSTSSSDELDFRINLTEFRYILLYIRNWFDVFVRLEEVDGSAERRVDLEEFQRLIKVLESEWGTSLLGSTGTGGGGGGGGSTFFDAFLECSGKEFDALDTQRCGFVLVESVADWVAKKDLVAQFDPLDEAY